MFAKFLRIAEFFSVILAATVFALAGVPQRLMTRRRGVAHIVIILLVIIIILLVLIFLTI